jgi:hypothetical protein
MNPRKLTLHLFRERRLSKGVAGHLQNRARTCIRK